MDGKDRAAFYYGAAVFLDLEADEVDEALAGEGLSTDEDSVAVCRDALARLFPERYERGRVFGWRRVLEASADDN